jgi:hypothetical protein
MPRANVDDRWRACAAGVEHPLAALGKRATRWHLDELGHAAGDGGQPGAPRQAQPGARGEQAPGVGVGQALEHRRRGAASTTVPAYITISCCTLSAITPKSWLISSSPMPSSRTSSGSGPAPRAGWSRPAPSSVRRRSAGRARRPARWRSPPAGAGRRRAGADRHPAAGAPRGSCTRCSRRSASRAGRGARHAAVQAQRFGDLPAYGVQRVEGGHRLLEHHADAVAAQLAVAQARRAAWPVRGLRSASSRAPARLRAAAPSCASAVMLLPQPDSPIRPSVPTRGSREADTPRNASGPGRARCAA